MSDRDEDNFCDEKVKQNADCLSSQSWTCCACGRYDVIGEECTGCGAPRLLARTVQPDSAEVDRMLEMISTESSTVQDALEVPCAPNIVNQYNSTFEARTVVSMKMSTVAGGPPSQSLERTVSSITGSIFEETLHMGINCPSELRGINHFPLSESTGSVEVAKEVPTPAPQPQDQLQPQASCLPGQEPNGPGVVAGSEGVVWRCDQCRIANSVRDPTCAQCRTKRPEVLMLGSVFFSLPSVGDPAKAQLALEFIASEFPLFRPATNFECSVLVEALRQHGPRLKVLAELGVEALKVVSWNNLSFIVPSGGFDVLYTLMNQHANSAKVALHGCSMTERSCIVSAAHRDTIGKAGGLDAIVTVLRIHAKHVEIARAACSALHNLATDNAENQSAIVQSDGVAAVLSAVSASGQDADVAKHGCAALDVLLTHTELTSTFVDAGGMDTVIAVMCYHPNIVDVTECGCSILIWMMRDGPPSGTKLAEAVKVIIASLSACLSNATAAARGCAVLNGMGVAHPMSIVRAGGAEVLFACLRNHDRDLTVVENALNGICNLLAAIAPDEMPAVLPSHSSVETVTRCISVHLSSPLVTMLGCAIIRKMVAVEGMRLHFVRCGGIDALCAAARSHLSCSILAQHVCCSVSMLSRFAENTALILQADGVEVIISVMQNYSRDVIIAEHGSDTLAQLGVDASVAVKIFDAGNGIATLIKSELIDLHERPDDALQLCEALFGGCFGTDCMVQLILDKKRDISALKLRAAVSCGRIFIDRCRMQKITVKGVEIIMSALQRYAHDPTILKNGCAVLHPLADSIQNIEIILELNGVKFALAAMCAHPDDPLVFEQACWVLWRLAANATIANSGYKAILEADGLKLILSYLCSEELKLRGTKVITVVCDLLVGIAGLENLRGDLVSAGGVDVTLKLLAWEQSSEKVFGLSCNLVERLAFNRGNILAFCKRGAIENIHRLIKRHKECLRATRSAHLALNRLISNSATRLEVINDGGFEGVVCALTTAHALRCGDGKRCPTFGNPDDEMQVGSLVFLLKEHLDSAIVARHGCNALLQVIAGHNWFGPTNNVDQKLADQITIIAKAIWPALRTHYQDECCFISACKALTAIAAFNAKCCAMVTKAAQTVRRTGDISVLPAIRFHNQNARVVESGCALLRYVVRCDAEAGNMPKDPLLVVEYVAELVCMHQSHANVVEHCCAIFGILAEHVVSKQDIAGIAKAVFPSIFAVLRDHSGNAVVVEQGCCAMDHLAKRDLYLAMFGTGDILQILLDILLAHQENDIICGLVWSILYLSAGKDSAGTPIVANHNIRQLLEIAASGTSRIANNACAALFNISPGRFRSIVGVDTPMVVDQLLTLMERNVTCAVAAGHACRALHHFLSSNKEGNEVALSADIVRRVLSTMRAHKSHRTVALHACGVLRYLSLNGDHATALINSEGIKSIFAALHDHMRYEDVGVHACEVLRNLIKSAIEGAKASILAPCSTKTIQLLLSFLNIKVHSPSAAESGCLLLLELLSDNLDAQTVAVKQGGIAVLLKLLSACHEVLNPSNVGLICNMLWMVVTDNEDHQRLLRRVGGRDVLQQVILRHSNDGTNAASKAYGMLKWMELLPKLRKLK